MCASRDDSAETRKMRLPGGKEGLLNEVGMGSVWEAGGDTPLCITVV